MDNIKDNYIKIEDLVVGRLYDCYSRGFEGPAMWNGKVFIGNRYKFGRMEESEQLHWDSDPRYGTVKPIKIHEPKPCT